MDPAKKIAELEAKRDALEKQLVPGIDKDREIAIRQQIIAVDNQITTFAGKLSPPEDNRNVFIRGWDEIVHEPVKTGGPALASSFVLWWSATRYYMLARHQFAPYTDTQLIWREWIFRLQPKFPATMTKIGAFSAFLLVLRGWSKRPPPSSAST